MNSSEAMTSGSMLEDALHAAESMGPLGFFLTIALCFSVSVMSMPTTPVELAAGCLYGAFGGTIVGTVGKTVGAIVPFVVARTVGLRWGWKVPDEIRDKYLRSIQTHPVTTTMAIRVAPIPCGGSAKNTALGLLGCPSSSEFVIANVLVYTPFSFLWASLGCQTKNLVAAMNQVPQPPPAVKWALRTLGPMALIGLLLVLGVTLWRMRGQDLQLKQGKPGQQHKDTLGSEGATSLAGSSAISSLHSRKKKKP